MKTVKTLNQLHKLALKRKSVIITLNKVSQVSPAAWVINYYGHTLYFLFKNNQISEYEKKG